MATKRIKDVQLLHKPIRPAFSNAFLGVGLLASIGILGFVLTRNSPPATHRLVATPSISISPTATLSPIPNPMLERIPIVNGAFAFTDYNGQARVVHAPSKFSFAVLSPDKTKVLLLIAAHGGGSATKPELAVMNADGTGYMDFPYAHEAPSGGYYFEQWAPDNSIILRAKSIDNGYVLYAYDTKTGNALLLATTPQNVAIDICKYVNSAIYCQLRNMTSQVTTWNTISVKNETFVPTQLPQ